MNETIWRKRYYEEVERNTTKYEMLNSEMKPIIRDITEQEIKEINLKLEKQNKIYFNPLKSAMVNG